MRLSRAATTDDYKVIAKRRLPSFLYHYIESGAGREYTAAQNCSAMDSIRLEPRVMVNVEEISLATELFGSHLSMPVVLGPVGLSGLFARRGEVQAQRAALSHGIPFCLSTLGICTADEVAAATGAPPWFQLYMIRDRSFLRDLLRSVRDAGVKVLILTADVPLSGIRHRDRRHGLNAGFVEQAMQAISRPDWLWNVGVRGRPLIFGSIAPALPHVRNLKDFWPWLAANFDPSVSWDDLAFVRSAWDGKIIVKGIMNADDARAAVAAGADGIVVSNHGGRQLEGAPASIERLPTIAGAVGSEVPVLIDGGVRSGIDVVRAMASGARACLLGRAWAYALAAGGEAALCRFLEDMGKEIRATLAFTGCTDINRAGRQMLADAAESGSAVDGAAPAMVGGGR